jgi:hypothetical protein
VDLQDPRLWRRLESVPLSKMPPPVDGVIDLSYLAERENKFE